MIHGRSQIVRLINLGIMVLLTGCATIDGKPLYPLRIPPSRGDGNFRDISWRYPWPVLPFGIPLPGYVVKFPAFDLGEEYHAEFAVEDLHDIGQKVGVYLFVDRSQHSDVAQFEFEVCNSKGQSLAHANRALSEFTWSTPLGIERGDGSALYSLDESFFRVQKGERYTLRVKYRPDPALRTRQGFVYLQCGGSA